jgi:hypothetical protein
MGGYSGKARAGGSSAAGPLRHKNCVQHSALVYLDCLTLGGAMQSRLDRAVRTAQNPSLTPYLHGITMFDRCNP